MQVPPLLEKNLYLAGRAFIDSVRRANGKTAGAGLRPPTRAKDIIGWMDDILTRHGCRGAVMRADAMALENREAWVAKVERGRRENG